jgi:hypothetical protein
VTRFDVYNDAVAPNGIPTDTQAELKAAAPIVLFNQSTTGSEGVQCFRLHTQDDAVNSTFHITYDKDLVGRTIDISGRSSLNFSVRFHERALMAGDEVFIFVQDGNGTTAEVSLQSVAGVSTGVLDAWQSASIPTSAFTGIDWTKVKMPFGVRIANKDAGGDAVDNDPLVVNHFDPDFDDIRYQP